jgi:hypothetical protein
LIPVDRPDPTSLSSDITDFLLTEKDLKSMIRAHSEGKTQLMAVIVRRRLENSNELCSLVSTKKRNSHIADNPAPAPEKQDIASLDPRVQSVLRKHSAPGCTLGPAPTNQVARGFEMKINLLPGARPKAIKQYRLTPIEQADLKKQVTHLIDMGWIQPSVSPWSASILFAPKSGGKLRLCIDYRYLNENAVKNRYPLPRIDELLDKLSGYRYFSALDLASGYHQIRIEPGSKDKTAFRTHAGLYEWNVMPFGLTNAPSVFQAAMHKYCPR